MLFGTKCPCNSGKSYKDCCRPFLEEDVTPPTAEALVRSRFTALKNQNVDYVIKTNLPKIRKQMPREQLEQMTQHVEWVKLEVQSTEAGGPEDVQGKVEFIAHLKAEGKKHEHHEISKCLRVGEKWFYADGKVINPIQAVRKEKIVGRNDRCPCGSGKKYKKCCEGKKIES